MSFKKPSKYFSSEAEFKEWAQLVMQAQEGTINGKKIGSGGVVPKCDGVSFAQMKKMYDSFDNIDLTKCISWSYKLLWEAAARPDAPKTKEAAIAEFNAISGWKEAVHFDPDARDSGLKEVMAEIFSSSTRGLGLVDELRGSVGKKTGEYGAESPLFGDLSLTKIPTSLTEVAKVPLFGSDWDPEEAETKNWNSEATALLSIRASVGDYPDQQYVFCPVRRFPNERFDGMNAQDIPKTPEWLDKWCLKYVEKNLYLWWNKNPVAGSQHGWHGNYPGQKGAAYRRETEGELKEWSARETPLRKAKDPIIQQVFEYKRAWSTLDNLSGKNTPGNASDGTSVKESFVSTKELFPTHYCVYNPYTKNNGTVYHDKAVWAQANYGDLGPPEFKIWSSIFGATSDVLDYVDEEPGFTGLYKLVDYVKNQPALMHQTTPQPKSWYPGRKINWDLETALQAIRIGPSGESLATSETALKEIVDQLFSNELGMGRHPSHFGDAEGQIPVSEQKVNYRAKDGSQKHYRMNLLDPVYKIQVNKPWMAWSMRMVLFIIDCTNKGMFKNLPKDYKPFDKDQKNGENYLKFVINLIWAIFEDFGAKAALIKKTQEQNDKVPEKSLDLIKQKNVGKQIQKNMQCFMLNLVDHFAAYHKDTAGSNWIEKYEFLRITGDNANIFNLIGYKPDTINKMLNIKPDELALMQPRIKLYKERRLYRRNKKGAPTPSTQVVEVEGPFSTHTNTENLEKMLAAGTGRSMGGGIKEITIKQEGGDADFDVPSFVTVEITFLFNTMQEIFLNFPSFDAVTGKVSFPYGLDPKYAKFAGTSSPAKLAKLPASYAELIFPINTKDSDYLGSIAQTEESTNVILEVGWTPPEGLKNLNKDKSIFFKNLNKQNLFRSYLLNPFDSEFSFTNEGQVELVARYHGIVRSLRVNPRNKLFPAAGIRGEPNSGGGTKRKPLKDDKEIQEAVGRINELERKRKKGIVLSGKENTELLTLQDNVRSRVLYTKEAQYDDFVERQLQNFIDQLFLGDETIYTVEVPKAFLGGRTIDNNILKWKPTRDIDMMRAFPRSVSRGTGQSGTAKTKISSAILGGTKENAAKKKKFAERDALKKQGMDLDKIDDMWKDDEEKKTAAAKRKKEREDAAKVNKKNSFIKKKAQKALQDKANGFDVSKDMWPITFFYFGDFVQSVLKESYESYSFFAEDIGGNKFLSPTEKLNYILGTVLVPIIKGKVQVAHSINLADLPITMFHLSQYIVDSLITPEAYKMTRMNFIWGLLKSVIREYFNSSCFVGQFDTRRTKPQLAIFNMPSVLAKDKGDGSGGIWKLSKGGSAKAAISGDRGKALLWTKETFKNKMKAFEAASKKDRLNINKRPQYKYAFIGTRSMTKGSFDRAKDMEANVHHFYFGAGVGLLKNISFKSEELEGMTESLLLEGINAVNPQATAFIPRLFNCSLSMIGNTLFDPGQTFYVDPTMGTMLGQVGSKGKNSSGINVIRDTGLGGYFYIASIETRIAPGVFETTIEGLKTGITKKSDTKASFDAAPPDVEIPGDKEYDIPAMPGLPSL